jgi:uridine kinase
MHTALPAGVVIRPEYFDLAKQLRRMLATHVAARGARTVIGVAGESGSGKSVTAICLARDLEAEGRATLVLHQDDYFHLPPRTNHEHRMRDLSRVGPQEVQLELLAGHVAAFRSRQANVDGPVVDYPNNRFLTQRLDLTTPDVLLVEGTYALMLPDLDVRIFLEATHEETRERRAVRNRDIDEPMVDHVLAIEHQIIAAQRGHATLVIGRDFVVRSFSL